MFFLSHMLHVCYFSILIRLMNGYLLFAANLEDFRAIAKKLVPETVADRLTRISDKTSTRDKVDDSDFENTEEASTEADNDSLPPIRGKKENYPPIKGVKEMRKAKEIFELDQGTKVDFDELVERVKKRLTAELKQTYIDNIRKEALSKSFTDRKKQMNDKLLNVDNEEENNKSFAANLNKKNMKKQKSKYLKDSLDVEEMSPFKDTPDYKEDIFNKPKVKQKIKTAKTSIEPNDYEDAMNSPSKYSKPVHKGNKNVNPDLEDTNPLINKMVVQEFEPTTNPSDLYKKMDLTQHDSYEDYVTPAKENIYASSEYKNKRNSDDSKPKFEHKRYKIETNRDTFQKNLDNDATVKAKDVFNKNERDFEKSRNNYDYTEKNVESEEVKAKTENLWYDNYEKVTEETSMSPQNFKKSQISKKSRHGTGLPTRHTYKMVTPNFVANFPVVVEKYDFEEPIPEKDRERETLKYIGNPPASINKKIRLT